jgi:hypothetical protein
MAGPRMAPTHLEAGSGGLPDFVMGVIVSVLFGWLDADSRLVTAQSPLGGTTARRGDTVAVRYAEPGLSPATYG